MVTSEKSKPLNHLGIIVDGNRRWAKANGLPVVEGHRRGYTNLKDIAKEALNHGINYISAYVFSTENWNRSKQEVDDLMGLLSWVLKHEVKEFHKENIRLKAIGSRNKISPKLIDLIDKAEKLTANNSRGTLLLCLDYGGQQEISDAVTEIVKAGLPAEDITPETISKYIYAPDVPPIDLIIRTSGEQRLSNFMTWRSVYSELLFVDKNWPDFNKVDLVEAIETFNHRQRRFGA